MDHFRGVCDRRGGETTVREVWTGRAVSKEARCLPFLNEPGEGASELDLRGEREVDASRGVFSAGGDGCVAMKVSRGDLEDEGGEDGIGGLLEMPGDQHTYVGCKMRTHYSSKPLRVRSCVDLGPRRILPFQLDFGPG